MSDARSKIVIDIHTHVFNSNYLPLKGIFISWGVPAFLARPLTKVALALTSRSRLNSKVAIFKRELSKDDNSTFNLDNEIDTMSEILAVDYANALGQELSEFKSYKNLEESSVSRNLSEDDLDLFGALVDLNNLVGDEDTTKAIDEIKKILNGHEGGGVDLQLTSSELVKSSWKGYFIFKLFRYLFRKISTYVDLGYDYFDFLREMTKSEKAILTRLISYYDDCDEFLCVHQMMDMSVPFDDQPSFEFYDKQITRMHSLEKHSKGKLLGMSAFDPLRFVGKSKEEIEGKLGYALNNGKVGFKLYPPMGFMASNNEENLQRVIDIFFEFCCHENDKERRDIPIFVHCNMAGFEVSKGSGFRNSHPKYWYEALRKFPNLRVCFAHGGGSKGWMESKYPWGHENNFASSVVELCRYNKNVYCDLSHLDIIISNNQNRDKLRDRLVSIVSKDDEYKYAFKDKVMFGSDWHMPLMVNDIKKFFSQLDNIFEDEQLKGIKHSFFARNAVEYLVLEDQVKRISSQFPTENLEQLNTLLNKVYAL